MLPPIKRAKNAGTLFNRMGTSSNPTPWRGKTQKISSHHALLPLGMNRARKEVELLALILQNPGITSYELAAIINDSFDEVSRLLRAYKQDGLVVSSKSGTGSQSWYLEEN